MLLAVSGLPGCRSPSGEPPAVTAAGEWTAKSPWDGDDRCADVRDVRVCWGAAGARLRPIPLPFPGATPGSVRCYGTGAARRCVERFRDAPRFRCSGDRCEQEHPRLPDHGEWECADLAGIVSCHGGAPAAGIAPSGADPSFVCGPRRGADAGAGERVCLDYSPDLPDEPGDYRCHFEARPGLVRVCARAGGVHRAGESCDAKHPCVSGLSCVEGRCAPPAPPPACWLDAECPADSPCRFGACVKGAP